jgi:hypothetical protein
MVLALLTRALPTAALASTLNLFVVNFATGNIPDGTIGKYTTAGKTVNSP